MLLLFLPALVGARLLFVAFHWKIYRQEPGRIWRRIDGGAALYGGLVLSFLVSLPLLRGLEIHCWAFWDAATIAILIGMIFTRVGCLLHGCCAGRPADSLLSCYLPNAQGIWRRRFPTQLFEAALAVSILLGIVKVSARLPFEGSLFLSSAVVYGGGRWMLEANRETIDRVGKCSLNRMISAAVVVTAATVLLWLWILGNSPDGYWFRTGGSTGMTNWYFLFAPIAVLPPLLLFRFVGCDSVFDLKYTPPEYFNAVKSDTPVIYLRLQERPGEFVAQDEMGVKDGRYNLVTGGLSAGDPNWRSTDVPVSELKLELGVTDSLLSGEVNDVDIRVAGGEVIVSAQVVDRLTSLTEFSAELMLAPEWNLTSQAERGKYYSVLELVNRTGGSIGRNVGFGIYAGPDTDANSPYVWQLWVGNGQPDGFERLMPKPYKESNDPGPTLSALPTYLVVTFSQSQAKAFLYMWFAGRDVSHTTYELVPPLSYVPAAGELVIGLAHGGPLFPPFVSTVPLPLLYPFKGRMAEVAVYDKVLTPEQVCQHGFSGCRG
jgi:hypothetical protein